MANYLVEVRTHFSWQMPVEDKDLTTSPSVGKGARYIVAGTGGDWSGGSVNDIAQYNGATWDFYTPLEGWFTWINDENKLYYFNGSSWGEFSGAGLTSNDLDDFTIKYINNKVTLAPRVEVNLMHLAFLLSSTNSLSVFSMMDLVIDEFEDETGVDTGSSSGQTYNSSDDYYRPTIGSEIDYMEYSSDANAQSAYVNSVSGAIAENFETAGSARFVGNDGTSYEYAQSFILDYPMTITQISLLLTTNTGSPGNATIRLETNTGGNIPSGTLVDANATWTGSLTPSSWNVINYTDFNLDAGTYWVVWRHSESATNGWRWSADSSAGYTRGTSKRSTNGGVWTDDIGWDFNFRIYGEELQVWSEDTIVNQGTYSLKTIALATDSLNDTLTKSGLSIDLTGVDTIKIDCYALRTGSNFKIGIHDSGGTTTEKTVTISSSNTWEEVSWDISGVSTSNKDDIDSIIITIINADADNIIYLDNFRTEPANMTLISIAKVAESAPSTARIVIWEEDVDSITINTDLKAWISRDDGSNYSQVTLADEGDYETGKRILTGVVDISGQPSDTDVRWKLTTHNNVALIIHGVSKAYD